MLNMKTFARLTRIKDYLLSNLTIIGLIFLISPENLFSPKTIIVFLANLCLTAFIYAFNDVEDAEDDCHVLEKRKRNPIANKDLTKTQGYIISFSLLLTGLFLLSTISFLVFSLGLILALVGFLYSWKPVRFKSILFIDLISHIICLGVLQFFIAYLTFRTFDLFVIPFLMIIIPYSLTIQILFELKDFEVDKKTRIRNTIQKLGKFDIKKLLIFISVIAIIGFIILIFTVSSEHQMLIVLGLIIYMIELYKLFKRFG